MTTESNLNKAVEMFLNSREYTDIQSVDYSPINFIAHMDDDVIFIHARIVGKEFDEIHLDRPSAERALIEATFDGLVDAGKHIRFDTVSVVLVGDDRALIRHHINCINN